MIDMIASYDLETAIDAAVQEEVMNKQIEDNNKTIEHAIKNLADALQDQKRIKQVWPDAPIETGVFSHMELNFDLYDGKVTVETAAKDTRGDAYYQ